MAHAASDKKTSMSLGFTESAILICTMIPSAGDDIIDRAPAMGPIVVASTAHNSRLWVVPPTLT